MSALASRFDHADFVDAMGLPRKVLPAKTYEGGPRSEPTLRYFVDKFTLFLDRTESLLPPVVRVEVPSLAANGQVTGA